jgi:hypothetical protein
VDSRGSGSGPVQGCGATQLFIYSRNRTEVVYIYIALRTLNFVLFKMKSGGTYSYLRIL